MLQSVIVSGGVINHISNVNGVLQYTRITALYNTSVIFLAVQHNYLHGHYNMLVADFEIIITKPFPAALMLSPFRCYGTMVSASSRKPAISIANIAHRV